jgi:hypothetical protein
MRRVQRGLFAVLVTGALVVAACSDGNSPTTTAASSSVSQPASKSSSGSTKIDPVSLKTDMRKLWEDHVQWTRLYIVSAVAGLPDADATLTRLLQNQTDIGTAVAGFYGNDAGTKLTSLLKDHIAIAGELVTAAKTGDNTKVTDASTRWYANADAIATFLAGANPAWPEATLKDMMKTHLDQTLAEATAQLTGDYTKSVSEYDHIVTHIVDMADTLSAGIVTQFPDRFTG